MTRAVATVLACALVLGPLRAAEIIDTDLNARLRAAMPASQVMRLAQVLTDRFGVRPTGSAALEDAGRWAAATLEAWGLANVRLEPWEFGTPGWTNEVASLVVEPSPVASGGSPAPRRLHPRAVAWTPGTDGLVTADLVLLEPPGKAAPGELDEWFARRAHSVRGRVVLVGTPTVLPPLPETAPRRRLAADELVARYTPAPAPAPGAAREQAAPPSAEVLGPAERDAAIGALLVRHGAVARLSGARDRYGLIRVVTNVVRDPGRHVPWLVVPHEDHALLARWLAAGLRVRASLEVRNALRPEGRTAFHVVGEIPGADRAGELVMLGAHLDAHHFAQGATDNAIGVAVVMEAVRLLTAAGARPRRTIRLALWSGEEQRVAGSQAYVRAHFGSAERPAPAFDTLSAYFNLDNGTGRIRGMHVFGPPAAGEVLRDLLAPWADLGVVGATTYRNRTPPGSDHAAFSVNGLPGVWVDQDPLDYGDASWHSTVDTFERLVEDDAKQAAVVMASVVHHVANREARLPRFAPDAMPPQGSR